MPNIYVRSTDGSNTDDGSTWALAKLDLAGAAGIDAAGDTIYVSDNHAESTAGAISPGWAGTSASPVRIICVDDSAEPPTATATTGTVTTTGNSNITISAYGSLYVYGLSFIAGSGATGTAEILLGGTFESCDFTIASTGTGKRIQASGTEVHLKNCRLKYGSTSDLIDVRDGGRFVWEAGSFISGTSASTKLVRFVASSYRGAAHISGVDLSNLSSSLNLFEHSSGRWHGVIRNCKLPASWSGSLTTGTLAYGSRAEMYNCDSTDTNYRIWIADYAGTVTQDTTVYLDSGKYDGTTRLSYKFVTTANADYEVNYFVGPEFTAWNETTGSSVTATVEIVHNSQGSGANGVLNDDEIWLEVMYLGTSGLPLGTWIKDCKATVLTTATAQDTSSESWTGDAAGWDTQKLSVTFTPEEKGTVIARVVMGKASATVYVDPNVTLT